MLDAKLAIDALRANGYASATKALRVMGKRVAYVFSSQLKRQANLKVLEFDTNGVYGDYIIKVVVIKMASNSSVINYGLAWR